MSQNKLRILLLSDVIDRRYDQKWDEHCFDGIDLIISCGDLPASYLEFIATMFHGDVLYVAGNHDERYLQHPPQGCICIDDQLINWHGVRILGLGGAMGFSSHPYQLTEKQMKKRVHKLWLSLYKQKGFDILVTHAPAKGYHDGQDLCHQGFETFKQLIHQYQPRYFFHGHVHFTYGDFPRLYQIENTTAINGYSSYIVEIPLDSSNKDDETFYIR